MVMVMMMMVMVMMMILMVIMILNFLLCPVILHGSHIAVTAQQIMMLMRMMMMMVIMILKFLICLIILHGSHIAVTTPTGHSSKDHEDSFSHIEQTESYIHCKLRIWIWHCNEANVGVNNNGS